MARSAPSLLSAALRMAEGARSQTENQATEVLSVVLKEHEGFARRLFSATGLDISGTPAQDLEVRTQVPTGDGDFVDLEAVAWGSGGLVARLWCENKVDAPFGERQLERYAAALPPGNSVLTTIVRAADRQTAEPVCSAAGAKLLTWEQLAATANAAGRADQLGPTSWRKDAARPNAPAQQRVLADFVHYLEERLLIVTDPLSINDTLVLRDAHGALAAATALTNQAVERCRYPAAPGPDNGKVGGNGIWQFQCFEPAQGQPPAWRNGWYELFRSASDKYAEDTVGESALFAGVTLPLDDNLASTAAQEWRREVRGAGFHLSHRHRDHPRVFRPLYLAEVATKGSTLDAQVQYVADWIADSFDFIAAHPPPPTGSE